MALPAEGLDLSGKRNWTNLRTPSDFSSASSVPGRLLVARLVDVNADDGGPALGQSVGHQATDSRTGSGDDGDVIFDALRT